MNNIDWANDPDIQETCEQIDRDCERIDNEQANHEATREAIREGIAYSEVED